MVVVVIFLIVVVVAVLIVVVIVLLLLIVVVLVRLDVDGCRLSPLIILAVIINTYILRTYVSWEPTPRLWLLLCSLNLCLILGAALVTLQISSSYDRRSESV
jgi:hypothetical protein